MRGTLMANIHLPAPGRPYVLIEADGERAAGDIADDTVVALYKTHGALLLRGFGGGLDEFRAFTARFCATSVFNESPGRDPIDDARNIHSVNRGMDPFPLHPELSREPWKPDVCFFCCFNPPRAQGETTICDGVEIVRHMLPEVRAGLEGRRLFYVQPTWPALLDFWLGTPAPTDAQLAAPPPLCPYSFQRLGGQIARVFSRPALHRPMFNDAPAFGNFLLFSRFYNGVPDFPVLDDARPVPEPWLQSVKATGDRLSAAIAWEGGDLLMLDNTRFMHGRAAIVDADERLIASYFGYLRFALPNSEESADPPWRRTDFRPPMRTPAVLI
ncbi:MAG: TauD/TfdA family dioxygenase [Sphingomonadaceae bacterium]|nr:TauD/TfdA family dioxygenase [Sphingomonadaceae bacterium]